MEQNSSGEMQLDEVQMQAIKMCTDRANRLCAVSGPAGSGKTTIIRSIYDQALAANEPVALCAPTGKAARRIKEATGIDAVTIHKLLEYNRPGERDPKTGKALDVTMPKRSRKNPLTQKLVLVDEYAMVNQELHNNLLAALPSGGRLCAFGDIHQLPPIEPYAVQDSRNAPMDTPFQKLLKRDQVVVLEKIYRQGEGSAILVEANKIRQGHTPAVNRDLGDFYIKIADHPVNILRTHVKEMLEEGISYRDISNQIIVPGHKSWVGTKALNGMLRTLLNPRPEQTQSLPRHAWQKDDHVTIGLGDKIVCTTNTYDLRPYWERFAEWTEEQKPIVSSYIPCPEVKMMLNGETGIVDHIYPDGSIDVNFGDRVVEIPYSFDEYNTYSDIVYPAYPLREIDLAYALTTHKCQGSEFTRICYVLNKSSKFVQSRQNFYTAITRARSRSFIITDQQSLRHSLWSVKR